MRCGTTPLREEEREMSENNELGTSVDGLDASLDESPPFLIQPRLEGISLSELIESPIQKQPSSLQVKVERERN